MDRRSFLGVISAGLAVPAASRAPGVRSRDDPLPSWSQGPAREAILGFVAGATREGGAGYVPPEERIAVFDNDGTLWVEQPAYAQSAFAFDRVKAMASDHPEWAREEPFRAILEDDAAAAAAFGEAEIAALLAATHAGMTTDEFADTVRAWLGAAEHPRFGRLYTGCVYRPQLELLGLLRSSGFTTFIVSGGGVEFLRVLAPAVYGVPPERVVGSSGKTRFEIRRGGPALVKLPEMQSLDDGPGKPVNINLHIGRRPVLAVGNSDGDLQMLQYTAVGESGGAREGTLAVIVRHDDAEREYAYDRESKVGRLDKALDEASARGWVVVSMRDDWKAVFGGA